MANNRQPRKTRARQTRREMPSCAEWLVREVAPLFRRPPRPVTRSTRHLRNAGIEVLEAVRALLDETIEWLRKERPAPAQVRRIRVQG